MVKPAKFAVTFTIHAFPAGGREDLPLSQKELEEYAQEAVRSWMELVPQLEVDYEHIDKVTFLFKKLELKRLPNGKGSK